jgi:hypothetical protein
MALSERTKTNVTRTVISETSDLYPDRQATPNAAGGFDKRDTTATHARLDIATTTKDMSRLFKSEYGDEIYGSHAKAEIGMNEFIEDIEFDYGREDNYEPFYVNTLSEKLTVGEQLEEGGGLR